MRLSVRTRLVILCLAHGLPPSLAWSDMPASEFADRVMAAKRRGMS